MSTQDRKAHLYSACNYSTHNIIAVITKYDTWQHLGKVGSVYSVHSGNALKTQENYHAYKTLQLDNIHISTKQMLGETCQ